MKHHIDKLRVGEYDRRRKLTDDQRKEIRRLHDEEGVQTAVLAATFGVGKSTIRLLISDTVMETRRKYNAENWRRNQTKKQHYDGVRNLREHKRKLLAEGKINFEEEF